MHRFGRANRPACLCVCIAEISLRLNFEIRGSPTLARIADQYAAFLVPERWTTPTVQVRVEPGPAFIPTDSAGAWRIRSSAGEGRLEFESYFEAGWLDWQEGRGSLLMRPRGNPENFLRVVYAWRCLDQSALMLHACGVLREGVGYVFLGPSGSGKTTVAGLSSGHTVLSDDIVVIKKRDGRFHVYGVPFRGDLPEAPRTNAVAPLGGLFALAKDVEHRIAKVGRSEAVARLASCAPFVMADPASARRVVDTCAAVGDSVPVRALHFRRDDGFWRVIDGLA